MKAQLTISTGNIVKETEKAIQIDAGRGGFWLPKSQIEIDRPEFNGYGTITMPIWLAKQSGLWGYNYTGHSIVRLI